MIKRLLASVTLPLIASTVSVAQLYKISSDGDSIPVGSTEPWECVYDDVTGLTWENVHKYSPVSWEYATKASKNLCSKPGWRLPTKSELMSLVVCPKLTLDYFVLGGACPEFITTPTKIVDSVLFPNLGMADFKTNKYFRYWTSDTVPPTDIEDTTHGFSWVVNMSTGDREYISKDRLEGSIHVTSSRRVDFKNILPSWEPSTNRLIIPKFKSNPLIKSATIKLNLKTDEFEIIEYQYPR